MPVSEVAADGWLRRDGEDPGFGAAGGRAPIPGPDRLVDYILSVPEPRVVVVQDVATKPGKGSLLGAVHVNILRALGCAGAVTNGAVRDLPSAEALQFPLFASHISVSHSYIHIIEFGTPVEVDGLKGPVRRPASRRLAWRPIRSLGYCTPSSRRRGTDCGKGRGIDCAMPVPGIFGREIA